MAAFVPGAGGVAPLRLTTAHHRQTLSPRVPPCAPFLASAAFGASVHTRAAVPPPHASLCMEVKVVVGDREPIESALRRFKKDVIKSGHLFELRRRRYFETNTEKRLRKAAAARRKARIARLNMNAMRARTAMRDSSKARQDAASSPDAPAEGDPAPMPPMSGAQPAAPSSVPVS